MNNELPVDKGRYLDKLVTHRQLLRERPPFYRGTTMNLKFQSYPCDSRWVRSFGRDRKDF